MNARRKIKKSKFRKEVTVWEPLRLERIRGLQNNKCVRCEKEWVEVPRGSATVCPSCRNSYIKWMNYDFVVEDLGWAEYLWLYRVEGDKEGAAWINI